MHLRIEQKGVEGMWLIQRQTRGSVALYATENFSTKT